MKFIRHAWWAVRHGDWSCGWDKDWMSNPDEPFFSCAPVYYDGYHCYVRIGKLWFGVSY